MKLNREEFVRRLERVQAGLAVAKGADQATAFNFGDGFVIAFNGQTTWCRSPSGLDNTIDGAVEGKRLLDAMKRVTDDTIEVEQKEKVIWFRSESEDIKMASAANLHPKDMGWTPKTNWHELDQAFSDAIDMVQGLTGKETTERWITTTVHVTPNWVEAGDGFQACRYCIEVPISERCVVVKEAIKHVIASGVTEISEDQSWLHFRSPDGLYMSFRKHSDKYPDLDKERWFSKDGEDLTLPKSLMDALILAEGFVEDKDAGRVLVELTEDEVRVTAVAPTCEMTAKRPCRYTGPELRFMAGPKVLKNVIERGVECQINSRKILIDGNSVWRFVCTLRAPEE